MLKFAEIIKPRRASFERILVDMNTQCDLLLPKGAMPVINRAEVLHNIQRMMSWARAESLPVVSSMECRRIGDKSRGLPPYCIDRSPGQKKVPITLLPKRIIVHNNNTLEVPDDMFRRFQQIILMKRSPDFLSNPMVDQLFNALSIKHVVFFGAIAERCVKTAVLSFLARRQCAVVVTDACGGWSAADGDQAMRQMAAKGAVLVTTEELISGAADERLRNSLPVFAQEASNAVPAWSERVPVLAGGREAR